MGANMGILPRPDAVQAIRDKRERYLALSQNRAGRHGRLGGGGSVIEN